MGSIIMGLKEAFVKAGRVKLGKKICNRPGETVQRSIWTAWQVDFWPV